MEVIDQFSSEHVKQVHMLYQQVWWGKTRTLAETKACVSGSQVCVGIVNDQGELVGFARVLSDFIYKAVIFDVIVAPDERGKGLGIKLMELIKHHPKLNKVRHFELYCLPDMEPFYEQFGFTAEVGGIRLLRCENT
ncbi:GNAT family N-acetyltransferase [Pseudoalteromonas luteoviolacea]|uniref:GNAT family N-acetyltransferase n=1 Tax=Pseudoalteromonas luteoviolacea TaxID=43657 RepID=UPI001F214E72|nr:GNAT family N-acetyltransferase [Pseudoalteromonas luteoviolacea]MCF6440463.1 GNAT family N-acetyltransferase [Pseudoalteromonas luteoviolacea]